MANLLPRKDQILIVKLLGEDNSLRAITRLTGIHRTAVTTNLMVRFGKGCSSFLERELRDIKTEHVESDEQWS